MAKRVKRVIKKQGQKQHQKQSVVVNITNNSKIRNRGKKVVSQDVPVIRQRIVSQPLIEMYAPQVMYSPPTQQQQAPIIPVSSPPPLLSTFGIKPDGNMLNSKGLDQYRRDYNAMLKEFEGKKKPILKDPHKEPDLVGTGGGGLDDGTGRTVISGTVPVPVTEPPRFRIRPNESAEEFEIRTGQPYTGKERPPGWVKKQTKPTWR